MGSGQGKRKAKGRRPGPGRRLNLPDIGHVEVPEGEERDETDELDLLRAQMRVTMRNFDEVIKSRRHAIEKREALLYAIENGVRKTIERGGPSPLRERRDQRDDDAARSAGKENAKAGLANADEFPSAGAMASLMDRSIENLRARQKQIASGESAVSTVAGAPLVRLNIYHMIKDADPKMFKNLMLKHILRSRHFDAATMYDMMGAPNANSEGIDFDVFRLWIQEALGQDILRDGIVRIIYDYILPAQGVSPIGIRYELSLSSLYTDPALPQTYESLVDGKHGYPGVATNYSTSEYIQARFRQVVKPKHVLLSEPQFGAFQAGGWGVGYLQQCFLVIPEKKAKTLFESSSKETKDKGIGIPGFRKRRRNSEERNQDVLVDMDKGNPFGDAKADISRFRVEGHAHAPGHDSKTGCLVFPDGSRWITVANCSGGLTPHPSEAHAFVLPIRFPPGYLGATTFRLTSTRQAWLATGTLIFE